MLPRPLVATAGRLYRSAAEWGRRPSPVRRIEGPLVDGGRGSAIVIGDQPSVEYFVRRLFDPTPADVQTIPRSRWRSLVGDLDHLAAQADLFLARVPAGLADRRIDRSCLRVPEVVESRIEIPPDGRLPARARRSHRDNLRIIRQQRLTWHISHDPADYDVFYRDMYVPRAQQRFGDLAYVRSTRRLRRNFRQGGLVWICQDQRRIAGWIYNVDRDSLRAVASGTAGGETGPVHQGALAAVYAFGIELAHQRGKRYYHAGLTRPCLADGILMHKKRWGASLLETQPTYCDLLVRWDHHTPAAAHLLRQAPLIVRDGPGLSGVAVLDEQPAPQSLEQLVNHLAMPGLRRLFVLAPDAKEQPPVTIQDIHGGVTTVHVAPLGSSHDLVWLLDS